MVGCGCGSSLLEGREHSTREIPSTLDGRILRKIVNSLLEGGLDFEVVDGESIDLGGAEVFVDEGEITVQTFGNYARDLYAGKDLKKAMKAIYSTY